jgi:4-alpha-glucanotransferase
MFRIDHFRGLDEYWAVPAGEPTAERGSWKKGPGEDFFMVLKGVLGELPVLAEDLGFMTEGVRCLRESQGFPGMRVCQFGFEDMKEGKLDARHLFLPHNYGYPWAAYTGTHDNDTTAGWYSALSAADKKTAAAYLNCPSLKPGEIAWAMIRAVMASHAKYAIFPLQDLLGLGAESRMNTPATCGGENWSWRLGEEFSNPEEGSGTSGDAALRGSGPLARRFAELVSLYSR